MHCMQLLMQNFTHICHPHNVKKRLYLMPVVLYLYCEFLLRGKRMEASHQVICMKHKHPVAQETCDMVGFQAAE